MTNKIDARYTSAVPRGGTKHCCYGLCRSDSRYSDREYMQGVGWIPFPKPRKDLDRCLRWIAACGRADFGVDNIRRWTYICTKHFVGGNGPSEDHPDPIQACNATSSPIQRRPKESKMDQKRKLEAAEALVSLTEDS
ncbi:hypothetical protein CAPTEDRAFT_191129 [Capitella teleta]|uniref:THAP-type domain-containing protein n=1 Tax=Capitella teleta TaxID=283909 RepID=R7UQ33_CAPTE|nr:hypothetical protein CAPTEDRAFT_191129 [Capitella teleta]|eukprot:ELU08614.1 hypothetical protein CAPTEDRAFT_191129 [Capitella teleta]